MSSENTKRRILFLDFLAPALFSFLQVTLRRLSGATAPAKRQYAATVNSARASAVRSPAKMD